MKMTVDRISLMKSEQIKGKLTYTEIYSVELKK
jgi:2'-5' RNA ligase